MLKGKWWLIFALTHFSIILVFFLFHLYFFKDVSEPCGVSIILRRACDVTNASRRVGNHLLNILVRQKSTTIINGWTIFLKKHRIIKRNKNISWRVSFRARNHNWKILLRPSTLGCPWALFDNDNLSYKQFMDHPWIISIPWLILLFLILINIT